MGKLLVVDDNPTDRLILRRMLETNGYEVDEVCDGSEVLEKLNKADFDLVFLDIFMQIEEGFETLTNIQHCNPDLPVVIVSCAADTYGSQMLDLGAREAIQKPVDRLQLLKTVSDNLYHG